MPHSAALPFTFRRGDDVVGMTEITSTKEVVHGLLRLEDERLFVQWRRSRTTERVGMQIRTDRELEAVRELSVPLTALAGARVRWSWRHWPPGVHLVLTAGDLRAFEEIAGEGGLRLDHPAQLAIRVPYAQRMAAQDFASRLELALADHALRDAERVERIAGGPPAALDTDAAPRLISEAGSRAGNAAARIDGHEGQETPLRPRGEDGGAP